jgi:hypothetical protein
MRCRACCSGLPAISVLGEMQVHDYRISAAISDSVLFISQRLCRIDSCNSQSWHRAGNERYHCQHQDDGEDCRHVINPCSIEHTAHRPQCSCAELALKGFGT